MKTAKFLIVSLLSIGLFAACTKNSNPKTIYDTVTVVKNDTIRLPPPNDTPNLTNGLVLYLPFTNGSFADSSGLNNTVTAIGGATLGYDMHGYAQSAFNSTGNGAVLAVTNNGSYSVDTAFSLSFDFTVRNNNQMIFCSIVDMVNGNGPTFNVGINLPSSPETLTFGINSSTSDCGASGDGNPLNRGDTTTFVPQPGSWYNAICTFTAGTVRVYINGQLIQSSGGGSPSVLFCPNSTFVVGGWWNGDLQNINGEIDELRFYNRTLSAAQIAWLSRNFQIHSNAQKPGLQQGGKPGLT